RALPYRPGSICRSGQNSLGKGLADGTSDRTTNLWRGAATFGLDLRRERSSARLGPTSAQIFGDALEGEVPPAPLGLAIEPQRRIPGRILTIEQPAPVGNALHHNPSRAAERAGEMG